jgi:glycine cleavage system H lipoate-binding protein
MILEGFYGQRVELREDLLYYPAQELWVRPFGKNGELAFGVTHAGVILVSGFTYLEYIVEVGDQLEKEDDVLFVETYKAIFNIQAPISGRITQINENLKGEKVSILETHCYENPFFSMVPKEPIDHKKLFLDVEAYKQALLRGESDHCGAGARVQRRSKYQKEES